MTGDSHPETCKMNFTAIKMHECFVKTRECVDEVDLVINADVIDITLEKVVLRSCNSQTQVSCVSVENCLSLFNE